MKQHLVLTPVSADHDTGGDSLSVVHHVAIGQSQVELRGGNCGRVMDVDLQIFHPEGGWEREGEKKEGAGKGREGEKGENGERGGRKGEKEGGGRERGA